MKTMHLKQNNVWRKILTVTVLLETSRAHDSLKFSNGVAFEKIDSFRFYESALVLQKNMTRIDLNTKIEEIKQTIEMIEISICKKLEEDLDKPPERQIIVSERKVDYSEHHKLCERMGALPYEIRTGADLDEFDKIVKYNGMILGTWAGLGYDIYDEKYYFPSDYSKSLEGVIDHVYIINNECKIGIKSISTINNMPAIIMNKYKLTYNANGTMTKIDTDCYQPEKRRSICYKQENSHLKRTSEAIAYKCSQIVESAREKTQRLEERLIKLTNDVSEYYLTPECPKRFRHERGLLTVGLGIIKFIEAATRGRKINKMNQRIEQIDNILIKHEYEIQQINKELEKVDILLERVEEKLHTISDQIKTEVILSEVQERLNRAYDIIKDAAETYYELITSILAQKTTLSLIGPAELRSIDRTLAEFDVSASTVKEYNRINTKLLCLSHEQLHVQIVIPLVGTKTHDVYKLYAIPDLKMGLIPELESPMVITTPTRREYYPIMDFQLTQCKIDGCFPPTIPKKIYLSKCGASQLLHDRVDTCKWEKYESEEYYQETATGFVYALLSSRALVISCGEIHEKTFAIKGTGHVQIPGGCVATIFTKNKAPQVTIRGPKGEIYASREVSIEGKFEGLSTLFPNYLNETAPKFSPFEQKIKQQVRNLEITATRYNGQMSRYQIICIITSVLTGVAVICVIIMWVLYYYYGKIMYSVFDIERLSCMVCCQEAAREELSLKMRKIHDSELLKREPIEEQEERAEQEVKPLE